MHGSNFNDGVWTYRREGEWIVGENSFPGPDKDMDAEIRLYFRYSAHGRVVWDGVEFEEREPIPARPVKIAVGWGAHDLEHWEKFLDAAGEAGTDIALLPEFFNAALEEKPAEPIDGPAAQFMSTKARQWKMYVAGAFKRSDGDLVFNSCPLFDREGKLVGVYDKNMLYDPELEGGLTPGVGYPVFDADFGKVGIITCYDSWFPEPSRLLGYKGAELALLPNAGYDREIMPARAADNGLVFAVSSTYSPAGIWDSGGAQAGEAKAEETRHAPAGAILSYREARRTGADPGDGRSVEEAEPALLGRADALGARRRGGFGRHGGCRWRRRSSSRRGGGGRKTPLREKLARRRVWRRSRASPLPSPPHQGEGTGAEGTEAAAQRMPFSSMRWNAGSLKSSGPPSEV